MTEPVPTNQALNPGSSIAPDRFLKKLPIHFDLVKLRGAVAEFLAEYPFLDHAGQLNLTMSSPDGQSPYPESGSLYDGARKIMHREEEFRHFFSALHGTYLHEVYQEVDGALNGGLGRVRLMKLKPRECYTFHYDDNFRYHVAIETNPACFLAFREGLFHVPADGHLYWMNSLLPHSAFNGSRQERLHMVFSTASGALPAAPSNAWQNK